ncbi:hypothetical protein DICPUDRAFT_74010 [Dictyostelium purpureum]|uniref:F-box domain-containing protein n=1 Tax=Dictyostelium purpureum TaxID=5786 RepID=F0Z6I1_DICPU|nr:uncharacterized protein DICPUDRAFT_74010 [Dictyostelium purpureum]EGC40494.1 hypothetical protein DICPUDRAFT_74010 [Dictyostelium purpureum]|eukprot:XP_003283041.1 hypothetical protein DICPUDRAFT_74010 [Dictyostelium purpureum]
MDLKYNISSFLPVVVQKIILEIIIYNFNKEIRQLSFNEWSFDSIPLSTVEKYDILVDASKLKSYKSINYNNNNNNNCNNNNYTKNRCFYGGSNNISLKIDNLAFVCKSWFKIVSQGVDSRQIDFNFLIEQQHNQYQQSPQQQQQVKSLILAIYKKLKLKSDPSTISPFQDNSFKNIQYLKINLNIQKLVEAKDQYFEKLNNYIKQFINLKKIYINYSYDEIYSLHGQFRFQILFLSLLKRIQFRNIEFKEYTTDVEKIKTIDINSYNNNDDNIEEIPKYQSFLSNCFKFGYYKIMNHGDEFICTNSFSINFLKCGCALTFLDLINNFSIKKVHFLTTDSSNLSFRNVFCYQFQDELSIYDSQKTIPNIDNTIQNRKELVYLIEEFLSTPNFKKFNTVISIKTQILTIENLYFILKLFPNLKYLNITICLYSLVYKLTCSHSIDIKNCDCNDLSSIDHHDECFKLYWSSIERMIKSHTSLKHLTINHICPASNYRNNCCHSNYQGELEYNQGFNRIAETLIENKSIKTLETSFITSIQFLEPILKHSSILKYHQTFSHNESISKDKYLDQVKNTISSLPVYIKYDHFTIPNN